MRVLKYTFVASLILLVAACSSRSPDPLIKEEVQASSKEDFDQQVKDRSFLSKEVLDIAKSLKNTNLYNDIDWIIGIFKNAIYHSNTDEEKEAIISSLNEVMSSNEKFTSNDYAKLLETLN